MKWVFASLTVLILVLVVYEARQPANEPTITIEGHQVPYRLVRVWKKDGGEMIVAYEDPETQIEYAEKIPVAKANEILAFQAAHKPR